MNREEIRRANRQAWDRQVERGSPWTVPVGADEVGRARRGDWSIVLTPTLPVPADWFPPMAGLDVLCLAGAGGQQGPILAAAGATVVVYDNSPGQLARDREVADRERLTLETVEGDMADLWLLAGGSFDLIVHPCSNGFVPDVRPVWREAFRVLRPGGTLLSGIVNPLLYLFEDAALERGELNVAYSIPYSDLDHPTEADRRRFADRDEPVTFGHTLDDQIGGQLAAGFELIGFFEDAGPPTALSARIAPYLATRARKPGG